MEGFDRADPFSRRVGAVALPARLRLGVPAPVDLNFFGNIAYEAQYQAAVARAAALGAEIVTIDYRPFREAAALLYGGPWVAERLHAVTPFIDRHGAAMDPVVRGIIEAARPMTAVDAFEGRYRLEGFRRQAEAEWEKVDALLLPTSPDIQTVAAMRADPVALNARFGLYTNFANFFGCAAIAVPAGFTPQGLPFGVQLVAPQDTDAALIPFAQALHEAAGCGAGRDRGYHPPAPAAAPAETGRLSIAVVGAHLSGMPLNHELTALGGERVRETETAPGYRLYALANTVPAKPGLVRAPGLAGGGIGLEIWSLPAEGFARFVDHVPQPLCIGRIDLADGTQVAGFLCEPAALDGARDITAFGGWRGYITLGEGVV